MPVPDAIEAICQRAREFLRRRQFPEAIRAYEEALGVDERDLRVHEGIAAAAFLAGDYDLAVQHFKRLSQIDLRRAEPLVNLGAVYNRMGDFNSAVKTLRQALSKNRKCAEAFYNLGIAYKGQNQLSMAVSAYKEAIRLSPEMAEAHQNLGNTFVEMGSLQQAINCFRRALEINPQFDRARRGLEAAQRLAQESARETTPFGRLVDISQIARQSEHSEEAPGARPMSDEERLADRALVHQLAVAFEQRASQVLEHVTSALGPALLALFHAVTQSEDKRKLYMAHETLVRALELHRHAVSPLLHCADELQAHEEEISRKLQGC